MKQNTVLLKKNTDYTPLLTQVK